MIRKRLPDLGVLALLFLPPLFLFAPVVLGSRTLVPADILFSFEPFRVGADAFGISHPHNHLLGDLILQNYAWKQFLIEAIQGLELPLWDPYLFSGHPFLANGQHSALYPLSGVFYVLPLWRAYGVFTWLQLGLAGCFTYLFARVLGTGRLGALIAGITFQLSGFMTVSVVHPMIIAGASWLPFILAMAELVVQRRPAWGGSPTSLPWVLLGAGGLGCQMLAGHAENTYFVLLVTGLYAAWRLGGKAVSSRPRLSGGWRETADTVLRPARWLLVMVVLGLALGAIQFVPLYEVAATSFRGGEGAASLSQVREWAYPLRRVIAFGIPNFFGNPAHDSFFDLFSWERTAALRHEDGQYVYWGIKNYVEGGAYLGLLPLFLSFIAVLRWLKSLGAGIVARISRESGRVVSGGGKGGHAVPFFTFLSLFSLGCIFGTPVYALVYGLPLLKQSHSPFRWVFPLTLAVAVMAAFGVDAVQRSRNRVRPSRLGAQSLRRRIRHRFLLGTGPSLISALAGLAFWGGVITLTGLALSRILFVQIEPMVESTFLSLTGARTAFADHRDFYSYQCVWAAVFGLLLVATGIVLRTSRSRASMVGIPIWEYAAVGLLVIDLITPTAGFFPALDPAMLEYTPPVVEFLQEDDSVWRYAAFTPPGTTKTMRPNVGMLYNLQTVAGYDSLFGAQYRDFMELIEPQDETQYNLIASFREHRSLDSPLTDHLNVKYIITEATIASPRFDLVYQDDAVRVYENLGVMPRAFTLPRSATVKTTDFGSAVQAYDPRHYVILEDATWTGNAEGAAPGSHVAQTVSSYTINEVVVETETSEPSWLVLGDTAFPGWKAFVQPAGAGGGEEQEVEIHRVNGVFRGVVLDEPGAWTVRFRYSPDSVKVGGFASFIGGMTMLFLVGLYLWRFFYRESEAEDTARRVAKNSVAPMVLNFFNRFIDFAFAALMARILGPSGMGRYFTAVNIYLWFDTLANFGLDVYLMREVARDRSRSRQIFINTTLLRLILFAGVIPFLGAFLVGRQALDSPLTNDTIWAVVLLYLALLPGTIANSLTALFRAVEKHEYPAAIQTVTTIIHVTLGAMALAGGLGIVGLASTSVLTNVATVAILAVLAGRTIWRRIAQTEGGLSWSLQRGMLAASWPLMGSLLLQSLFLGANVVMLQYLQGDQAVGWYNAASKWVMNMLNIVPSLFTFAVFPILSRQAVEDDGRLRDSYRTSVKLLTIVAFPTAVVVTLMATPMVWVLSGAQFLPHGAITLRLLVWSIVFGWINSLTNYLLIALNRQRYVVWASGARVGLAVVANLVLVPRFSYVGSAWIIIAGEFLLTAMFAVELRRQIGSLGWGSMVGRPALATLAMGATAWAVGIHSRPLAVVASLGIYVLAAAALRVLTLEERNRLGSLIPAPLRRALGGRVVGKAA